MTSHRISNGGQVGAVLVARESLARFSGLRHMKLIDIFSLFFLLFAFSRSRNEKWEKWRSSLIYSICLSDISHLPKWVSNSKSFCKCCALLFPAEIWVFFRGKKGKINGGKTLEIWTCAWKRSQDKLAALSVKQRRRWRRLRRTWETLAGPVLG